MKVKPGNIAGKLNLKDKRVQIGLAAAAIVGLFVLVKRGGSTPAAGTEGGQSVNTGTLDSTGTDSYNAIAQIGQAWQAQWDQQFNDFSSQLTDINSQLGQLKQPVTPIPQPPAKIPPINPNLAPGTGWRFVKPGETVASVAKKFKVSEATIRSLNSANALNRFSSGETIRIRGAAGPKTGK